MRRISKYQGRSVASPPDPLIAYRRTYTLETRSGRDRSLLLLHDRLQHHRFFPTRCVLLSHRGGGRASRKASEGFDDPERPAEDPLWSVLI